MKRTPLHAMLVAVSAITLLLIGCQPKSEADEIESKVEALLSQMTLQEKVNMIHASSSFTSGGVERLGIPELVTSDGPHGVRHEHGRDWTKDENVYDSSTYLPVGTALASTWNRELGYKFGKVLGAEANFRGKDVILGPGLNIIRSPVNGRNFEYLTEDPYLNAQFVTGYVKGVQEQGVAACAKHYIANSLEYEREKVNVTMSDRALREIYLPGFKAAVDAGVLSVMSAYNKFRGVYCSHSTYLLDELLKDELGFDGIVISDWNAVKGTDAVNAGVDIEFGTDLIMQERDYSRFHMGDTLIGLVESGQVDEAVIDEKVRRVLRVMHKINKFGKRQPGAYNTPEHQQVARDIAAETVILLKNEELLPLDKSTIETLAVVGANADWKHAGAGGSSQVKAYYEVTPLQGIRKTMEGLETNIEHAMGYEIARGATANSSLIRDAVKAVANADAAVYIGGWIHGYSDEWNDNAFDAEVVDKPSMQLPFGQNDLIEAVLDANPNTVIVLVGGGPVDIRAWEDQAKAIIQAPYGGMEGGSALAAAIFGELNPSGKLTMTWPEKLEDSPAHGVATYPDESLLIDHKEGIFVGYRYFDSYNVEPAFAFGHGLSYTDFQFSDLFIDKEGTSVKVTLQITNTGDRAGAEVAQVYVQDLESRLERPEKELKGFEKVFLEAGASTTVSLSLPESAFQYYDDSQNQWVLEPGVFSILVGSSSRDIRLEGTITL